MAANKPLKTKGIKTITITNYLPMMWINWKVHLLVWLGVSHVFAVGCLLGLESSGDQTKIAPSLHGVYSNGPKGLAEELDLNMVV